MTFEKKGKPVRKLGVWRVKEDLPDCGNLDRMVMRRDGEREGEFGERGTVHRCAPIVYKIRGGRSG